jgi:hypothetical protein
VTSKQDWNAVDLYERQLYCWFKIAGEIQNRKGVAADIGIGKNGNSLIFEGFNLEPNEYRFWFALRSTCTKKKKCDLNSEALNRLVMFEFMHYLFPMLFSLNCDAAVDYE